IMIKLAIGSLLLFFTQQASSAIKGDFEIFKECNEPCILSPSPGGVISTILPLSPPPSPNDEGLLFYSMTVEDRFGTGADDITTINVGDFAKITATQNYISEQVPLGIIKLDVTTSNGVKTFTYNRRSTLFNINWAVPVGEDAPTSIKFSVDEIDDLRRIIDIPKIYSVEVDNETLKNWEGKGKVSFGVTNARQDIVVSWPSVRYGESPKQHHRQKRWSEWHTGKLLCFAVPYKAFYNYITQGNCDFGSMWEGTLYHLVAGNPKDTTMRDQPTKEPIEHRIHFSQDNALTALAAHTVCGVPLETLARSRKPRDGLDCMYQAQNIVSLYILTRLPFSSYLQFVDNLLNGVHIESADDDAVNSLREIARDDNDGLVLASLGAAQSRYRDFSDHHPGVSIEQAQKADVLSLTCPHADKPCGPQNSENAHVNIEYPSGATFFADGEDVDFTLTGTTNWDENRLLLTHQRLLDAGYVFVGYHGTNHDSARALTSAITVWQRGSGSAEDELWGGLYVAANPEVAYGYANPANGSRGREHRGTMLRVYIPSASLSRLYRTDTPLDEQSIREHIEGIIGHSMPLANSSITAPESEDGPDETLLGWDMAIRSVAIPSMILGNTARGEPMIVPDYEEKISPKPPYKE
ncbi:exotoxin A binding domain-containing protein, partial [Aeromonas salmonicida]|uniref:exotoxin A binding domain-containing protein n=1 Tax=Aeromonas salmonicida TaxID=645 RepID=UPI0023EEA715